MLKNQEIQITDDILQQFIDITTTHHQ